MSIYLLIRFLHIASAMLLVGGVFARQLVQTRAKRAEDPLAVALGFRIAEPIEKFMVIPGSFLVVAFGVVLALRSGAPILGFLQGASRNWLLVSNVLILGTFLLVPLVFLPRGKVFDRRLQEAISQRQITPDLRASLNDPLVRFGHTFEIAALTLVVILMVLKPV